MNQHQHPSPAPVDDSDVLAALIPDTPASLTDTSPDPKSGADPIPDTQTLLELAEKQIAEGAPAASVSSADTVTPETDTAVPPLVPRWVWQTSASTLVVAAAVGVVAFVVWGVSVALNLAAAGLAAATAAAAAAAPFVIGAVVLVVVLVLVCRRGRMVEMTQTQTVRFRR